jgi:hypothetical protein
MPGGLLGTVLRMLLGVLAFVLMLGALLVGAVLALGVVAWALLRGRRPGARVFSTSFQRMRRPAAGREDPSVRPAWGGQNRPAGQGAVIDIEVREVPDNGRPGATLQSER